MAESHRLYVKGKHLSYQRSKRVNNPNVSLIKIEGVATPQEAQFYLGKRIAYVYRASKEVRGSKIRVMWGKVTRTHDTRVTVSSGNLTPHNSNLRTPDFLGGSVDVGNTLTQVKLSILWSSDTFDLDQRDIWVVDSLGSLVG